jgi:hypothetical protein
MCLASLILALGFASATQARIVRIIRYSELFKKADLVVIAQPLTKTIDTKEQTYFDDLIQTDKGGRRSPVPAIGVETTFDVLDVLKGSKTLTRFVLHHYRDISGIELDGPATVSFDPSDPERRRDILLFLVREKDGRYEPYDGQTDPSNRSIFALDQPP